MRPVMGGVAAVSVLVALMGCDGDGAADAGPGTDGGGQTDAGPGGTPADVSFVVQEGLENTPMGDVMVTFDAPGGARQTARTDAAGRVTFEAIWALGEAGVTWSDSDGFLRSFVRLSPDTLPEITLPSGEAALRSFPPPRGGDPVTVSGTFMNADSAANRFNVVASVAGATVYNDVGPDYSIEVPSGVPFRLFGLEYSATRTSPVEITQVFVGAQSVESPALDADATIDFDLATSLPYQEVSGTIPLPTGRMEGAGVYGLVRSRESFLTDLMGSFASSAPAPGDDTLLQYTFGAYDISGLTPVSRFQTFRGNVGAFMNVDGLAMGAQPSFPNVPTVTAPVLGVPHPLHDPITVDELDPDLTLSVLLLDVTDDDENLWAISSLALGDAEVSIPQPPEGMPVSALLPAGNELAGRVFACGRSDDLATCERLAVSDQIFDLVP